MYVLVTSGWEQEIFLALDSHCTEYEADDVVCNDAYVLSQVL